MNPHSLSVGIIFASYALHVRFLPFLDPCAPETVSHLDARGALATGVKLIYVRGCLCVCGTAGVLPLPVETQSKWPAT
jgi:hypothetical protein